MHLREDVWAEYRGETLRFLCYRSSGNNLSSWDTRRVKAVVQKKTLENINLTPGELSLIKGSTAMWRNKEIS